MSRVFKCDRCGEIFKENDGAERMVEEAEEEWDEIEERVKNLISIPILSATIYKQST